MGLKGDSSTVGSVMPMEASSKWPVSWKANAMKSAVLSMSMLSTALSLMQMTRRTMP